MSTLSREPARLSELMPRTDALLRFTAGLDERAPVVRLGEREEISSLVRTLVHRRDHYACTWCGYAPFGTRNTDRATMLNIDHIVPWSAGGSDRSDNLRTLCDTCNRMRSNYRTDMDVSTVLPIVLWCDPCSGQVETRPEHVIEAYCGTHSHIGWISDEDRIL